MLIDTNVLSELTERTPEPIVMNWFDLQTLEGLFVSCITLGELRFGLERREPGRRTSELRVWLEYELAELFRGRTLDVNTDVTDQWGRLRAQQARLGRTRPEIDALIAATAIVHDLTVVTRNVRDFRRIGLDIINPWDEPTSPSTAPTS